MRPRGKVRSPVFVLAASVLTLGLYFLWWQFQTFRDLRDHSGVGIGGWLGLAYAVISLGVVNWVLMPMEIGQLYRKCNEDPPVTAYTALWNLLPGAGTLVWIALNQRALNRYWTQVGDDD